MWQYKKSCPVYAVRRINNGQNYVYKINDSLWKQETTHASVIWNIFSSFIVLSIKGLPYLYGSAHITVKWLP